MRAFNTPRAVLCVILAAATLACEPPPDGAVSSGPEALGAQPGARPGRGAEGPPPARGDREAPPADEAVDGPADEPEAAPIDGPADAPEAAPADAPPGDDRQPPPPPGADRQPPPPPGDGRQPPPPGDGRQPPPPPGDEPVDAPVDEPVDEPADEPVDEPGLALPLAPSPADNPFSEAKVELGRLLFWDPILSGHQDVACATCHHPDFGYAEGRALSIGSGGRGLGPARRLAPGADFVDRNAPTVLLTGLNGWVDGARLPVAEQAPMFWDSRARSLEAQAVGPLLSAAEMRGDAYSEAEAFDVIEGRLRAVPAYVALFADAFDVPADEAVTIEHLAQAISAFERHLSRPSSAFDRFNAGDRGALDAQQVRGLNTLRQVGCTACHGGPMFSDFRLHRLGAPDHPDTPTVDDGDGSFRFRTPTLRNVAITGPFMHGGVFRSLDEVMAFYQRAGRPAPGAPPPPRGVGPLDPAFTRLRFNNGQAADMIAFLEALVDEDVDLAVPPAVPSGLSVGGAID